MAEARSIAALFRTGPGAWFLDDERWLFEQSGDTEPRRLFRVAPPPGLEMRTPTGLARWRDSWWVTDGRSHLFRLSLDGRPRRPVPLPVPGSTVLEAGDHLWVHSELPSTSASRFWVSLNGVDFKPVTPAPGSLDEIPRGQILSNLLVLSGSPSGAIFFSPLVGPPVLYRMDARGVVHRFALAYERSASRDALTRFHPGHEDLTRYSAPVKDLVVLGAAILVLRNREDEKTPSGLRHSLRKRVDRYEASGRHVGTAVFPVTIRAILREERDGVRVLGETGEVLWAPFGPPLAGRVFP
ncbi:MAG TPA: hypothetical protein VNC59_02875 [Thermoanaerobaculia bacterium]|nr:hypothetical protein [Thermoanaerobaculia bacterium]